MKQSTLHSLPFPGVHVAIIMDGSGRWATARGLPRVEGHRAGVEAVRRVVEAAPGLGIGTLTLFAFSSDNWQRPAAEVDALMRIIRAYLLADINACLASGLRMSVIGRRDRLSPSLLMAVEAAKAATLRGQTMHLRIAVDYSARDAIVRAARRLNATMEATPEIFSRLLAEVSCAGPPTPDVDLLIRTGGEQRLSDFLLWESAYAELIFTNRMWPDFGVADLEAAVQEFHRRERRFGRLLDKAAG